MKYNSLYTVPVEIVVSHRSCKHKDAAK